MRTRDYQEMVFTAEAYSNWETPRDEALDLMWRDIGEFLAMLMRNNQIATIYKDEEGIIVIEYAHCERYDVWGIQNPQWITEEEYWKVTREEEENEEI